MEWLRREQHWIVDHPLVMVSIVFDGYATAAVMLLLLLLLLLVLLLVVLQLVLVLGRLVVAMVLDVVVGHVHFLVGRRTRTVHRRAAIVVVAVVRRVPDFGRRSRTVDLDVFG